MIKKLHKRVNTVSNKLEPNEGERTLLCSNRSGMRSPSLDLGVTPESTEDEQIGILADILVEIFLSQHGFEATITTECSDLLSGVNKRAS